VATAEYFERFDMIRAGTSSSLAYYRSFPPDHGSWVPPANTTGAYFQDAEIRIYCLQELQDWENAHGLFGDPFHWLNPQLSAPLQGDGACANIAINSHQSDATLHRPTWWDAPWHEVRIQASGSRSMVVVWPCSCGADGAQFWCSGGDEPPSRR
jgi:hypothetical protein